MGSVYMRRVHNFVLPVVFFFVGAQSQTAHAQLADRLGVGIPPPPQAAALAKFAQTPVSLYTGVPSISIPIHEVKLRGVTLPIALNYHAGGVRVSEVASSVGLGWALEAGGAVSATVLGKNDLAWENSQGAGYIPFPTDRRLMPIFPSTDYELCMQITGAPRASQPSFFPSSTADTQPDLFYYNFCGRSGKFFHTPDSPFGHSMPYEPLLLHRDNAAAGYTITDETGNRYVFRATEVATTYITPHGRPISPQEDLAPRAKAYYLTQVENPFHETITLTYDTLRYDYPNTGNFTRYVSFPSSVLTPGLLDHACFDKPATFTESRTVVVGLQLATIRSSRGDFVEFTYSPCPRLDVHGGRALKQIRIHEGPVTRDFNLAYGNFNLPDTNTDCGPGSPTYAGRLKLVGVTEAGKPGYRLVYHEELPLPSRLSTAQDHWGFFNNQPENGLLPAEPGKGFYLGANREPEAVAMRTGTLKTFFYPTGGRTEFDFEPNTYYTGPGTFAHDSTVTPVAFFAGRDDDSTPDPSSRYEQATTFTVPATVKLYTTYATYKTGCAQATATATPQFTVTLTNTTGYLRTFTWEPNQTGVVTLPLALPSGDYTATAVTYGYCPDDFFRLRWTQTVQRTIPGANYLAGGLRIREIRDYANHPGEEPMRRRYRYMLPNDSTQSSGHTLGCPTYSYEVTDYLRDPNDGDFIKQECRYMAQSSNSVQPLSGIKGSSVAYTHIQVYQDKLGAQGMTAHTFSWEPDLQPNPGYPFTPPTSLDWQRGLPLEVVDYAYDATLATHYRPVRRTRIQYQHNYTPPTNGACEDCANYLDPTQPNETHALGLNIVVTRPETYKRVPGSWGPPIINQATFLLESFKHVSVWSYATEKHEYLYSQPDTSRYLLTKTFYRYDNPRHAQLSRTFTLNSRGDTLITKNYYALDYDTLGGDASAQGIQSLGRRHMLTNVVEQQKWLTKNHQTLLTGSRLTNYWNTWPRQELTLELATPIPATLFTPASIAVGVSVQDPRYRPQVTVGLYDYFGNILQAKAEKGALHASLWGHAHAQIIAQGTNAAYRQLAFTSFEPDATGRWHYDSTGTHRVAGGARTGRWAYRLNGLGGVGRDQLPAGDYELSYWAQSNTPPLLVLQGGTQSAGGAQPVAAVRHNWHQYRTRLHFTAIGAVTIDIAPGGSTLLLDEVRLYPMGAQMTSYTYDPLVGMTSQTDPSGRTTTYEYDALGRLVRTRDEQGRVLSQQQYHYARP